jgi:hypothetical protein
MTTLLDRSLLMAAGIFAAVLLILVLLVKDFKDALPGLPRFEPSTAATFPGPTNSRLPELFAPATLAATFQATNLPPPFFTTFFQPPPPPPKRLTRKVNLTYNGFFETAGGQKRAYITVGEKLELLSLGVPVVADVMISNIVRTELTLYQAGTQAVVIPFRSSKEVEVPAE